MIFFKSDDDTDCLYVKQVVATFLGYLIVRSLSSRRTELPRCYATTLVPVFALINSLSWLSYGVGVKQKFIITLIAFLSLLQLLKLLGICSFENMWCTSITSDPRCLLISTLAVMRQRFFDVTGGRN
ncbi:hypothetical protein ACFE04_022607 [Oxalis oulophora]